MDLNNIIQTLLLISGATGFLLISRQFKYSIYGYWIGLFSQPLWFAAAYLSNQWGIMLMIPVYSYGHWQGIRRFHEK